MLCCEPLIVIARVPPMHNPKMPKPITKSVRSVMASSEHQGAEGKDGWHPEPDVQPLLFAACEPEVN